MRVLPLKDATISLSRKEIASADFVSLARTEKRECLAKIGIGHQKRVVTPGFGRGHHHAWHIQTNGFAQIALCVGVVGNEEHVSYRQDVLHCAVVLEVPVAILVS